MSNLIVLASLFMFTLVGMAILGRPGRGCYRLVSDHGYALFGAYIVVQMWVNVLFMYACSSKVIMRNLMSILWNESS